MSDQATLLLRKQLRELTKNPVEGFSAGLVDDDNIFEWEIMIIGPPDTLYEGGFFKALMTFPNTYPLMPPKLKFASDMWHPNGMSKSYRFDLQCLHLDFIHIVYPDGEVCISILHPPGEDKWGYEKANERWLPVHTVETILISVISMLSTPNDESPANIEAAKEWREDYPAFKKRVQRMVRRSAEMI
ncbi:ubiquitin-conjugating enzyme/RWD-like protein [Endogone sp. FLAS-F59071]|nr:ubiquitin-conjugating enzyme/RWD-like protein [Endogone sp. FLAS-F59071]|eukprot:RUS19547.1 ubiquitin-conjugating enzyme/RWD-like protein [Endogone sp. FLAS-F59071]